MRDVVIKSNLDWILFVAGDYMAKECCAMCFYQGDVIQCYGQATEDEWLDMFTEHCSAQCTGKY